METFFQEDSESEMKTSTTLDENLQTVLFILKLKVTCLSRQLEELSIINKHLNQEIETKSQQLISTNTRMSMLRTQLQQKDNSLKELNDKYKRLLGAIGNNDPQEFKITILKLQKYEEIIKKTQEGNTIQYDSEESRTEITRLNELVNNLEVLNCYSKQSLQKEVDLRNITEAKFKNIENVIETLSAKNIQLLNEKDWYQARRKSLIYKHEELLRKNASLKEYSDSLREKYEALLLLKKKKKRRKENEILEFDKNTKTEDFTHKCEYRNAKPSSSSKKEEMSEIEVEVHRIKEVLVKNGNDERETIIKLEEKLESMATEISALREEKKYFEDRLQTSEENYRNLKDKFDQLAVTHKNLVYFKKEEQIKINERIIGLNERLDFLGECIIKSHDLLKCLAY